MPPAAFEALSDGRTLHFSLSGRPFGSERYLPGRRTVWRFEAGGACLKGVWAAEGDALCFSYEGEPGRLCWRLEKGPAGLSAELIERGAATGFRLELERVDDAPLACPGIDLTS